MEGRYSSSIHFKTFLAHKKHKRRQSVANTTPLHVLVVLGRGLTFWKPANIHTWCTHPYGLVPSCTYSHVWKSLLVWCLRNVKSWNSTFRNVWPVGGVLFCSVFGKPELSALCVQSSQTNCQVLLSGSQRCQCFASWSECRFQCSFERRRLFLKSEKQSSQVSEQTTNLNWNWSVDRTKSVCRKKQVFVSLCPTWGDRLRWCEFSNANSSADRFWKVCHCVYCCKTETFVYKRETRTLRQNKSRKETPFVNLTDCKNDRNLLAR